MRGNQFGELFSLVTFGESHGPAMGVVIDGCPAGVLWRPELLARFLQRRRPGLQQFTSQRQEPDQPTILSGVFEGRTLGTPIAALIFNQDARPADYASGAIQMRQGHATDLWQEKYGHSDPRGSGRASGRETVSRVLAGAVARMLVEQLYPDVQIMAFTASIGEIAMSNTEVEQALVALHPDPWAVDQKTLRCPVESLNRNMEELLQRAKDSGESYGGTVHVSVGGLPRGLGQPVFRKLKNSLADAYMSIGATCGVETGEGFQASARSGKEFHSSAQDYGGMRGGLSTGQPLSVRIAFKPTSSRGEVAKQGRHDPCIVPRAIPVVEAMTWLVLADQILMSRVDRV